MLGNDVQGRVRLVFLAFFSLVTLSVIATFWGIQAQTKDAQVINLAGRQRMLTQRMTWLALYQAQSPELEASIRLFEQILSALRDGGIAQYRLGDAVHAVTLPPAPDAELRAALEQAARLWTEFRYHLNAAAENASAAAMKDTAAPDAAAAQDAAALQSASSELLAELDRIVMQYEERADAKIARLQAIQLTSFAAALFLLGWGYWLARRRIFQPLARLGEAAARMAAGELDRPVLQADSSPHTDELSDLYLTFENLRLQVALAQQELEDRVARRTRELAAAFEFSQQIVAQLDRDRLLRSVPENARSLTSARASALCLLLEGSSTLTLVASSGDGGACLNLRQPLHQDPAFQVVGGGETVVAQAGCVKCGFLRAYAPGECAVAPLRAGDAILGGLCVVRPERQAFDEDEKRALTLLSNAAAVAIANARLVESGRRQAAQAAVLAERERLSAELHDNLAQTLSFTIVKVEQIKRLLARGSPGDGELEQMKTALLGAYEQVRAALVGLSDPPFPPGDFTRRLAACIEDARQFGDQCLELQVADPAALDLPRLAQAQALHVVREALANARRHAAAQHVWVNVERAGDQALFRIEDDGCGFDPQAVLGSHHLGLRLMRARAERSGGSLTIESTPGAGTRVLACFPLLDGKPDPE